MGYRRIAKHLNSKNIKTFGGKKWESNNVYSVLKRYLDRLEQLEHRNKAFDASTMYNKDTYGDAVIEDFIRIQRNIFREQQRIYRALQAAKISAGIGQQEAANQRLRAQGAMQAKQSHGAQSH